MKLRFASDQRVEANAGGVSEKGARTAAAHGDVLHFRFIATYCMQACDLQKCLQLRRQRLQRNRMRKFAKAARAETVGIVLCEHQGLNVLQTKPSASC